MVGNKYHETSSSRVGTRPFIDYLQLVPLRPGRHAEPVASYDNPAPCCIGLGEARVELQATLNWGLANWRIYISKQAFWLGLNYTPGRHQGEGFVMG